MQEVPGGKGATVIVFVASARWGLVAGIFTQRFGGHGLHSSFKHVD